MTKFTFKASLLAVLLLVSFKTKEAVISKSNSYSDKLHLAYMKLKQENENKLTKSNFVKYIHKIKHKFKFPKVVLKQIIIETGGLKSDICLENNNLFGFRKVTGRETTAIKGKLLNKYSVYNSFKESIEDYILWQNKYLGNCKTEKEYEKFLKYNYATDGKHYIETLHNVDLGKFFKKRQLDSLSLN